MTERAKKSLPVDDPALDRADVEPDEVGDDALVSGDGCRDILARFEGDARQPR